jgi:hypothetical protein
MSRDSCQLCRATSRPWLHPQSRPLWIRLRLCHGDHHRRGGAAVTRNTSWIRFASVERQIPGHQRSRQRRQARPGCPRWGSPLHDRPAPPSDRLVTDRVIQRPCSVPAWTLSASVAASPGSRAKEDLDRLPEIHRLVAGSGLVDGKLKMKDLARGDGQRRCRCASLPGSHRC